jgi:dihydroneopterin aldolase
MAERIAHICLFFDKVEAVRVQVDKPEALRYTRSVAVEIYREKPSHE